MLREPRQTDMSLSLLLLAWSAHCLHRSVLISPLPRPAQLNDLGT